MKKIAVSSLVIVLVVSGTHVFAQFKNPAKATKNLTHLERVIARAAQPARLGYPVVQLPAGVVTGNAVGLSWVKAPQAVTPVTQSYNKHLKQILAPSYTVKIDLEIAAKTAIHEWMGQTNNQGVFYTDQSQLARDLDAFYEGNAETYIGPDGREVKLYALPVNGILYQPAGYAQPMVLNSNEYFVIYDVASRSGKIAENIPEVYNLFVPQIDGLKRNLKKISSAEQEAKQVSSQLNPVYEEIWQATGSSKEFDDLGNLCDAILLAHLHKARIDRLQVTSDVKTLVKSGKQAVWKQLNSSMELLSYLQTLPYVRSTQHGFKAYVVELPVKGLSLVDNKGGQYNYTPQDHVMLFFEMGSVGIYPREDVENPELFTSVK